MRNIELFIETVFKMRTSQKEFFRTKSTIALTQTKVLEKQVDSMLADQHLPEKIDNQTKLL